MECMYEESGALELKQHLELPKLVVLQSDITTVGKKVLELAVLWQMISC